MARFAAWPSNAYTGCRRRSVFDSVIAFADLEVILLGKRAAMGLRSTFQLPPGNLR